MNTLDRMVRHADAQLASARFEDESHNGLQVQNSGKVTRIACGVDASMEFFERCAELGADLLICHHGLSWGDSLKRVTDLNYRRLSFLIRHDMALYASHLPLDAHPRLGNNAGICKAIGLRNLKPFGWYRGRQIGFKGTLAAPMDFDDFKERVARRISLRLQVLGFGPKRVRSVGVVSGGAAEDIAEAGAEGLDVFLTGEPKLMAYSLAQEYRINAIFAGHYATEVFGVKALGAMLARRYHLPWEFVDLKIRL